MRTLSKCSISVYFLVIRMIVIEFSCWLGQEPGSGFKVGVEAGRVPGPPPLWAWPPKWCFHRVVISISEFVHTMADARLLARRDK